jgi:signal transduction histidine kinase
MPRPFPLLGWLALLGYSLFVFWLSVPSFLIEYDLSIGVAFLLASVQCVTLPLAVRLPRTAMVLHLGGIALAAYMTRHSFDGFWPMTIHGLLALTGILVVIGLRQRWVEAVAAWWFAFLVLVLAVVLWGGDRTMEQWGFDLLAAVTVTLAALAISVGLGQRRRVRAVLADAKRDVELEQAKRQTVEERARIARELHDVVAHSMSIVHIQAESARYRVSDLDEAQQEFSSIAQSSRSALREMRQLLGALRPDASEAQYTPQPGIADIPTLIRTTENVGGRVTYSSEIDPGSESALLELSVYRIVQEALSNVVRHAPRAAAAVLLERTSSGIVVRVTNDAAPALSTGPPTEAGAAALVDDSSPGLSDIDSGGHGLRGMRERVALLGGTIVQEPLPAGGFLIEAAIPTSDPVRQETP